MPYGCLAPCCRGHSPINPAAILSQWLNLDVGAGNGDAVTNDYANARVTGDIDLRAKVAMTLWTPATVMDLITKTQAGGNNRAYAFYLKTDGHLALDLSFTGLAYATAASSVVTGIADGAVKWVRVTWAAATGNVTFYTSDDGSTWSQLGTVPTIGIPSIAGTGAAIRNGARDSGATNNATGHFYRTQIYNGIGGTLVYDANFVGQTIGAASFVESSANAATVTMEAPGALV